HGLPVITAIFRAEQPRRSAARVPRAALGGMTWSEPENALHGARRLAFGGLAEGRGLRGFAPGAAAIRRAKDRWAEVARPGGHEQRAGPARIRHDMVTDVAENRRPCQLPGLAPLVRPQCERPLAGPNPYCAHSAFDYVPRAQETPETRPE